MPVLVERPANQLRKFDVLELLRRHVESQPRRRYVLLTPDRELRASRVQNPTPDIDDEPAFLGAGTNSPGGRMPSRGVCHRSSASMPVSEPLETENCG